MYSINNVAITFDIKEFEKLCEKEKITWYLSTLNDLRKLLRQKLPPTAKQIEAEIFRIPMDKRLKYKSALKYLLFSWPGMVSSSGLNTVNDGRLMDRMKFIDYYDTMDANTDFVDLMYGIAKARAYAPYKLKVEPSLSKREHVRYADDFNNSSKLGDGLAFRRQWGGTGLLGVKSDDVRKDFRKGGVLQEGIQSGTRQIYANSMLNSRYSPEISLRDDKKKLVKDTHQPIAVMQQTHGKNFKEHFWAHASFVKSVRRACKGGIAMVASHTAYCMVDAKVHFVLDGLGDLGAMARKDALKSDKGDYVAITSSELAFCCRYWNDEKYPLSAVVKFYINGFRVMPPWEADYTLKDAKDEDVYSNQEAWLRYQLSQQLLSQKKPFPVMNGTDEPDEV